MLNAVIVEHRPSQQFFLQIVESTIDFISVVGGMLVERSDPKGEAKASYGLSFVAEGGSFVQDVA